MNTYDWNADDYAQHSSAQQQWARELMAKLHLQGNENILDIGYVDKYPPDKAGIIHVVMVRLEVEAIKSA